MYKRSCISLVQTASCFSGIQFHCRHNNLQSFKKQNRFSVVLSPPSVFVLHLIGETFFRSIRNNFQLRAHHFVEGNFRYFDQKGRRDQQWFHQSSNIFKILQRKAHYLIISSVILSISKTSLFAKKSEFSAKLSQFEYFFVDMPSIYLQDSCIRRFILA